MAAPKGNKFWERRSKHGRDKIFASAELLWEAACEYFTYCDENPWVKKDWVGKDAIEVERETQTPYTLSGLCLYVGASESWWKNFRKGDNLDNDFLSTITRIEDVIRTNKMEGAIVGVYNANIVSRDLGLQDNQEIRHKGIPENNTTVILSKEAAKDISDKLEQDV